MRAVFFALDVVKHVRKTVFFIIVHEVNMWFT